jgi:RNA polymerase sigma-70 factor (ECF subfamily)
VLRLCGALRDVTPGSLREFYRLAALQVRRELIDLARHHYGPQGSAAHQDATTPADDPADAGPGPEGLAAWTEFHERVGLLPDGEREVFDLVWYQGLNYAEAAVFLDVSHRTLRRR